MLSSLFGLFAVAGTCLAVPGTKVLRQATAPVVTVKNGSYSGVHNPTYNHDYFLGIPYAQPPVNDLRFRLAQSLNASWADSRPATAYSPFCVGYGGDDLGKDLSEDCLYLSVVRPSNLSPNASLPVLVWIHGGGLFMGGSNDARYNLSFPVQNSVEMGSPMIGISIQYRLSGWGFLGGKEVLDNGVANLGFRDQRLALHWVQENIAAFGGNPEKVTIMGESAGAQSVGAQLLAYNGRDDKLFSGAIAESGGPGNLFSATSNGIGYNNTAYQTSYDTLVSTTGCGNATSTLSCLRALPYETLNTALNSSIPGVGPFIPFIDNDFVATYPSIQLRNGDFVKVPLLIGTNSDEGNSFSPRGVVNTDAQFLSMLNQTLYSAPPSISAIISYVYPNIPALGVPSFSTWPYSPNSTIAKALGSQIRRVQAYFGDLAVNAPRRFANHQWASHGVESYSYRFDVTVGGLPAYVGATHFQEVSFVFNNTRGEGYAVNPFTANLTASESLKLQELSKYMSRSWVSFIVHDGNPNLHGLSGKPTWPAYSTANGALGDNIVWTTKGNESGAVVEVDAYRVEGMNFINENLLGVYGR